MRDVLSRESYGGELKVVEAVVSQDEPSSLPRLNSTPLNTEENLKKEKFVPVVCQWSLSKIV